MEENQLKPVGIPRRAIAAVLDLLILSIGLTVLLSILALIGGGDVALEGRTDDIGANFVLLFIYVVYYIAFELTIGTSPGKRLLGLRVARLDGQRATDFEVIIRNILRPVDSLFAYLVGAISVLVTQSNQRLGDLAAGTIVVRIQKPEDHPRL